MSGYLASIKTRRFIKRNKLEASRNGLTLWTYLQGFGELISVWRAYLL